MVSNTFTIARRIFPLILTFFLFSFAQSTPRAVVHIGPHKTSSSRIQSVLVSITKELAAHNYYWPNQTDGVPMNLKGISNFAYALKGFGRNQPADITHMDSFIQDSLRLNRSIILSSEEFDDMNKAQVMTLSNHLKGFNVTIVFVYRELLAQLISLHFELNRFEHTVSFSKSFASYLFGILDNMPLILRPVDILATYADVFGPDTIRIIDLVGTNTAGKDVAHVLLCQVVGILCDHTKFPAMNANSGYTLIPAQVFSFFKTYVEQQNNGKCDFCGSIRKEYDRLAGRYTNHTKTHAPPVTINTKLTMLLPYAQQADITLRATYGSAILHGNQKANFQAMAKAQVQELDPERFVTDLYWNNWIHSEYDKALAAGQLCNCGSPSVIM